MPGGGYSLVSVATDADSVTCSSLPDPFSVFSRAPTTSLLVPSSAASVSRRSSVLDASTSPYLSTVTYRPSGNGLIFQAIASSTPTAYDWLATWDTTTVPNGTYSLVSDAAYLNGVDNFSLPISITVNNPLPTTSILIPSKTTTLSGSTYLDAAASNATSVEFLLFGGSYGFHAQRSARQQRPCMDGYAVGIPRRFPTARTSLWLTFELGEKRAQFRCKRDNQELVVGFRPLAPGQCHGAG